MSFTVGLLSIRSRARLESSEVLRLNGFEET
jgi:hypothetical protein